jgi:hypothetical protein
MPFSYSHRQDASALLGCSCCVSCSVGYHRGILFTSMLGSSMFFHCLGPAPVCLLFFWADDAVPMWFLLAFRRHSSRISAVNWALVPTFHISHCAGTSIILASSPVAARQFSCRFPRGFPPLIGCYLLHSWDCPISSFAHSGITLGHSPAHIRQPSLLSSRTATLLSCSSGIDFRPFRYFNTLPCPLRHQPSTPVLGTGSSLIHSPTLLQ